MHADLVDLDRHPIRDLDSEAARGLVAAAHAALARTGASELPGSVNGVGLGARRDAAAARGAQAHPSWDPGTRSTPEPQPARQGRSSP
ncbi:MAG: hypothetical protein JWM47_3223 [Acidimicrobiales bacterium]|nr:hypothetical protein [Acidimicrobiales bacterium]